MWIRREFKVSKNPEKLTTRQMEFIEKLASIELDKLKTKEQNKLNGEFKLISTISGYLALVLIVLFIVITSYTIYNTREDTRKLQAGFIKSTLVGTSAIVWTKSKGDTLELK